MSKHLLAGAAAFGLISSAALAQTYIPTSPPPTVPPSIGVPGSTTTTTTVSPTTDHMTTITKGVDANGNEIIKKDTYREGVTGTTETHTKTMTDPDGGTTTTRSTTTTKQE
ncbi:MAG: hypothetical protein JO213_13670 [Alphaproteobacteria bacterium]|nr:hypothetical protein [Alphaproteobacteria bacterium]